MGIKKIDGFIIIWDSCTEDESEEYDESETYELLYESESDDSREHMVSEKRKRQTKRKGGSKKRCVCFKKEAHSDTYLPEDTYVPFEELIGRNLAHIICKMALGLDPVAKYMIEPEPKERSILLNNYVPFTEVSKAWNKYFRSLQETIGLGRIGPLSEINYAFDIGNGDLVLFFLKRGLKERVIEYHIAEWYDKLIYKHYDSKILKEFLMTIGEYRQNIRTKGETIGILSVELEVGLRISSDTIGFGLANCISNPGYWNLIKDKPNLSIRLIQFTSRIEYCSGATLISGIEELFENREFPLKQFFDIWNEIDFLTKNPVSGLDVCLAYYLHKVYPRERRSHMNFFNGGVLYRIYLGLKYGNITEKQAIKYLEVFIEYETPQRLLPRLGDLHKKVPLVEEYVRKKISEFQPTHQNISCMFAVIFNVPLSSHTVKNLVQLLDDWKVKEEDLLDFISGEDEVWTCIGFYARTSLKDGKMGNIIVNDFIDKYVPHVKPAIESAILCV